MCSEERPYVNLLDNKNEHRKGDLFDVKDILNRWLPAKIVDKQGNIITFHFRGYVNEFNEILNISNELDKNRITEYESHSREYGLNEYTRKYYSNERIEKLIKEKIEEEERCNLQNIYYEGRKIYYYDNNNNIAYEFIIVEFNEKSESVNKIGRAHV